MPAPLAPQAADVPCVSAVPADHAAAGGALVAERDDRLVALRRLGTATARAAVARRRRTAQSAVRVRVAACSTGWSTRPAKSSITRARIESEVGQIKGSLADLTDNLERLRRQLRDIELQAETQMSSRMERAKADVASPSTRSSSTASRASRS